MRVAVCFGCNETYMPLCRGLILSLQKVLARAPEDLDISLHFIDIGCSDASLARLKNAGAHLHAFSRKLYPVLPTDDLLPRYADAQLCRPFLPQLVRGHDLYVWIDADIWIQAADALPTLIRAAARASGGMVICPECHYGLVGKRDFRLGLLAARTWYEALYDDHDLVEFLSCRPMFNSGLFGLAAGSPVWTAWAGELFRLYGRDHSGTRRVLHFAEQLGLNKMLHTGEQPFVPLDPIFNYPCAGSAVFARPGGALCVGYPPFTPLKAAHLLAFAHYGRQYLDRGMLFEAGRYLEPAERLALEGLLRGKKRPTQEIAGGNEVNLDLGSGN